MIEKPPFTPYRLEEERENKRVKITVDITDIKKYIDEFKEVLDIRSDATALKTGFEAGKNAIFTTLGMKTLRYLVRKDRVRRKDPVIKKPKLFNFATQKK